MTLVVSDASPLINLARVDHIDVLTAYYGDVIIPMLMDEIRGRRIAKQLGLMVRGTLGILARAKSEGRITRLRPVLDMLRLRGTWIHDDMYNEILCLVGE